MAQTWRRHATKAKTADGLLGEIERLILADFRRYNQFETLEFVDPSASDELPPCGTIGCVAGWVTALKAARPNQVSVCEYAGRKLGLTYEQSNELFDAGAAGFRWDAGGHATRGAEHIRNFRRKYRAQLRAKKV